MNEINPYEPPSADTQNPPLRIEGLRRLGHVVTRPWLVVCIAASLWTTRIWLVPLYYQRKLFLGHYAPSGDAIGVIVFFEFCGTVIVLPCFIVAWMVALKWSKSGRLSWPRLRRPIDWLWTALYGALAVAALWRLPMYCQLNLYWHVMVSFAWSLCWIVLWLNAVGQDSRLEATWDSGQENGL